MAKKIIHHVTTKSQSLRDSNPRSCTQRADICTLISLLLYLQALLRATA